MNLMHIQKINDFKDQMHFMMYGFKSIVSKSDEDYYVPNYMFFDSPQHYFFMNSATIERLYGSNAPRMLALCQTLGEIANVQDKNKDIICFKPQYLHNQYLKDEQGIIVPFYMDNYKDIPISTIPSLIKASFLMRHMKESF